MAQKVADRPEHKGWYVSASSKSGHLRSTRLVAKNDLEREFRRVSHTLKKLGDREIWPNHVTTYPEYGDLVVGRGSVDDLGERWYGSGDTHKRILEFVHPYESFESGMTIDNSETYGQWPFMQNWASGTTPLGSSDTNSRERNWGGAILADDTALGMLHHLAEHHFIRSAEFVDDSNDYRKFRAAWRLMAAGWVADGPDGMFITDVGREFASEIFD